MIVDVGGWATILAQISQDDAEVKWARESGHLYVLRSGRDAVWIAPSSVGTYGVRVTAEKGTRNVSETISLNVVEPPVDVLSLEVDDSVKS